MTECPIIYGVGCFVCVTDWSGGQKKIQRAFHFSLSTLLMCSAPLCLCHIFNSHAIHAAILVLYVFLFFLNIMGDVMHFFHSSYYIAILLMVNVFPTVCLFPCLLLLFLAYPIAFSKLPENIGPTDFSR